MLLNLYRYPQQARDDLFTILKAISGRLWLPFHVALEYQRNRVGVIAGENAKFDATAKQLDNAELELVQADERLELGKRGLGIDTTPLTDALKEAIAQIRKSVANAKTKQLEISNHDPVRERLEEILADRIGPAPKNQAELEKLLSDGATRYEKKVPPGFKDLGKIKSPVDAKFFHDGIEYSAEFGDLIIWRQIINYAQDGSIKHLVFVTGDRKEDWWAREQGHTLGPLPELIHEIKRLTNIETFWMYPVDKFLEHASTALNKPVEPSSIKEMRNSISVIDFEAAIQEMNDRAAMASGRSATFHQRELISAEEYVRAHENDILRTRCDEWAAQQTRANEAFLLHRQEWPEYRYVDGDLVRGIHVSTGELHSHIYDLSQCAKRVRRGDIQTITIVFVDLPWRSTDEKSVREVIPDWKADFQMCVAYTAQLMKN